MKPPPRFLTCLAWAVGIAYTIFLIVRLFLLINRYSVNILWWDNFNYYFTLEGTANYWQRFTAQIGPHREGVGMLLSSIIAPLTRWNMRAESFAIGVILTLALLVCLAMKARAFGGLAWYDLIVLPSLFLTSRQYEIWSLTVNSSHSAIPLLLLMIYCLGWTLRKGPGRTALILCINFLSIFTGFGFFLGLVTPVAFAITRNFRAVVVCLASLALFFVRYKLDPANPSFRLLDPNILKFPLAIAIGLSHYFNFIAIPFNQIFGYSMTVLIVIVLVAQIPAALKSDAKAIIIASLMGFSILYVLATVEGRISVSVYCLMTSRYIPLLTPGFVGCYLAIPMIRTRIPRGVAILAAMLMALYAGAIVYPDDKSAIVANKQNKLTWIAHYQRSGSLDEADGAVERPIYPHPRPDDLPAKIAYLRTNNLNFFTLPQLPIPESAATNP
jgi:hypothetical protein